MAPFLKLLGIAFVLGSPLTIVAMGLGPTIQGERRHEALVQTGKRATATITAIQETGTVINRRPEVRVWMTVTPEGGRPFQSQETWSFSVSDIQSTLADIGLTDSLTTLLPLLVALDGPAWSTRIANAGTPEYRYSVAKGLRQYRHPGSLTGRVPTRATEQPVRKGDGHLGRKVPRLTSPPPHRLQPAPARVMDGPGAVRLL